MTDKLARKMDSANMDAIRSAIQSLGKRLREQEDKSEEVLQTLTRISSNQEALVESVREQFQRLISSPGSASDSPAALAATAPAVPAPSAQLGAPARFTGESGDCRSFLTQCEIHFEQHAPFFPTERAKVAYAVSHLAGRAESWATAEWQNGSACLSSFSAFSEALKQIFQQVTPGREAAQRLVNLRQGSRSASDYAIEFRTLAAEVGWDSTALCDVFFRGLARRVKESLAASELPVGLEKLIALAIKVDRRHWCLDHDPRGEERGITHRRGRHSSRGIGTAAPGSGHESEHLLSGGTPEALAGQGAWSSAPVEEPMQVGRTKLPEAEKRRRFAMGLCLYCGQPGQACH